MSNRSEIIDYAKARLETVDEAVFLGERPMLGDGEEDPEQALALLIGDDEPSFQGEQILVRLPLHVYAVAKADLDEPWAIVETLLAQIKAALEEPDRRWGHRLRHPLERGVTVTAPREPGATTVGAVITYYATYAEVWGTP